MPDTDPPHITVRAIRDLLDDSRGNAVLHIVDDSRGYTLAVWVAEYAPNIVISVGDCLDRVGTDDAASIDDQEIEDYILPGLQEEINEQVRQLQAWNATNDR